MVNGGLHWGALHGAGVNLTGLWTGNELQKNTTKRNTKELTNNRQITMEIATKYDKKGFDITHFLFYKNMVYKNV